jgi:short subunit dehydrogenase-like uncharacterized protein
MSESDEPRSDARPLIAVAGATGHTGDRVLHALHARGARLRLVGRDAARLARAAEPFRGATRRWVPAWDEDGLARAFEGCNAIISCAGPFNLAGWPVVRAAIAARVPYCDSSGEQAFIRRVFEELDGDARAAGVALVPAAGFDYVLGDLGGHIAASALGEIDTIEVVYAVAGGAMSAGTRKTMIESLAHTPHELVDGRLRRMRIGATFRTAEASRTADTSRTGAGSTEVRCVAIPGGEAIMVPRHVNVRNVRSFAGARGLPVSSALLALVSVVARIAPARRLIARIFAGTGPKPDRGTTGAVFACTVTARNAAGDERKVTLRGADPYDFTARALAMLAMMMAAGHAGAGALAPAQLVQPAEFLRALGVDVMEDTKIADTAE